MEETGDIIVVAINYRIGILGWLYDNTYGTGVEGNFGFLDQKMAIEWVYDNIAYFGGDGTNINIWGISAGAVSVGFHLLYNQQYITSGIMQSPIFSLPQNTPDSWVSIVAGYNLIIGCDSNDIIDNASLMLECWRAVNASDILLAQLDVENVRGLNPFPFLPTVGTELLPDQPLTAFQEIETPPFLLGMVKDEYWTFAPTSLIGTETDSYFVAAVAVNIFLNNFAVSNAMFNFYGISPIDSPSGSYVADSTELINDGVCVCVLDMFRIQ